MNIKSSLRLFRILALGALPAVGHAAIVEVSDGSYTTVFPGVDVAGRNGYPGGTPQVSGAAVGRPIPTNDWWSKLLNQNHADNLFNYPMAMGTLSSGLDIGLVVPVSGANGSSEPRDPFNTVVVGVSGLAATRATVDNYSDWTVTIGWDSGAHSFRATSGIGMPFVYFSKAATDTASVTVEVGTVTVDGEILLITNSEDGGRLRRLRADRFPPGHHPAAPTPPPWRAKTTGPWPSCRRARRRRWRPPGRNMPTSSRPTLK